MANFLKAKAYLETNNISKIMKDPFQLILFPYNGTKRDEKSFGKLIEIAKRHESKIIILTCLRDLRTLGLFKTKSDKKKIAKERKTMENKIDRLKKLGDGIKISSKIVKCEIVSKEIVDQSKKSKVDLVVMSKTKLSSEVEKIYYESTVDHVFKNLSCSFLHIK